MTRMFHRCHDRNCHHRDDNILENLMADLTKLTTDITSLIADRDDWKSKYETLAALGDSDQAAVDALDQTVVAALPVPPATDDTTDGSTPIGDSITPTAT